MKLIFAIILALALVSGVIGCAETTSRMDQDIKIVDPETGKEVFSKRTGSHSHTRAPSDASGPTTQSITAGGIFSSISGVHTKTAEQIIAGNSVVFYWVAAGFAVAAIVGTTALKSRPLAIGFGIAAGASALTPTFLNEVGPWLLPVGALALAVSLVWYLAKRHASIESSKLAGERFAEAEKAAERGQIAEALDLMRSGRDAMLPAKPTLNRAFSK